MLVKSSIFLTIFLVIIGCGVMNNPNQYDGAGESVEDASQKLIISKVSKIPTKSLKLTNINKNDITATTIDELKTYQLLQTKEDSKLFLDDLNSSAELSNMDKSIVQSWITNIQDADIEYQKTNLLFYPIYQDMDCGIKDEIFISDKNATIAVKPNYVDCNSTHVYHLLLYKIDKSIETIIVKAFSDKDVVIKTILK